ncbi:helix-turn-helix domain-containing protein [Novosphingobium fluoreni]|uniref:helix-turn-helix domain-containing protein n=1 Tax=Novosphingobium fluoreni TaxID=1391222 RepID=UPI003DA167BB
MANKLALLVLPGASLAGVGVWQDGSICLQEQVRQTFAATDKQGMDSEFFTLSVDGRPVRLADRTLFSVDGAVTDERAYSFIWLPAFLAENDQQFTAGMSQAATLHPWLRKQHALGATIAASGAAMLLLAGSGLTQDMALPLSVPLQIKARKIDPRLRLSRPTDLADRGDIILSPGAAHDAAAVMRGLQRALTHGIGRYLSALYGLPEDEQHESATPQMERAKLLLEQTFASNMAIQMVAERLSISPSAFTRQFRKAFHVSPKAYVQDLRLFSAKTMLERTNRKIDDIAINVGYSDSRLFRMMFKKATGQSAREWRANVQTEKGL